MTLATRIRRAFSLIEMMVAVALVVVVITAVGLLSKSMGSIVSISQASNEMLSSVRAAQYQVERDFAGIDRSCFLVIRSKADPAGTGRRFDMVSFVSNGAQPNRCGTLNLSDQGVPLNGPFNDGTVAQSALITIGHVGIEMMSTPPATGNYLSPAAQNVAFGLTALPSGNNENDFIIGRHAVLLMGAAAVPGGANSGYVVYYPSGLEGVQGKGVQVAAYPDPGINAGSIATGEPSGATAHITSARICVAAKTPGELMADVQNALVGGRGGNPRFEADNYCYRVKVLPDVYNSELPAPNYANAVFRMNPIMLQSASSFIVEWTDGGQNGLGLRWFGLSDVLANVSPAGDSTIEPPLGSGDDYTAIFSFDHRDKWPKALRLRYHVTDRNNRLSGGRDFTQIIRLQQ